MQISAWSRKPHTQLMSIIDSIFPVLMLVLHMYNFSVTERRDLELFRGLIDINEHWSIYILIWIFIYLANILEFYISIRLFLALKPTYPDAQLAVTRSQHWLQYSSGIFLGLLIKFLLFMVYLGKLSRVDVISLLICLADIIFRMGSAYIVKRFLDDLKSQLPPRPPSVFFINLVSKLNNRPTQA